MLHSKAGRPAGAWQPLSFDGGAFHLKRTGELARALLVLRLCAWPPLVTHGLALQAWSQRLLGSRLSGALLRASIYGQFVAGETAAEVRACVRQLQTLGLRPLLAVPTEEEPDSAVKTGEAWYEGNLGAMLQCVHLSRGLPETPGPAGDTLMQLKVTALASTRLCKELTSWVRRAGASSEMSPQRLAEAMDSGRDLQLSCLNTEQNRHLRASLSRLHQVVQHARAQRVRLLVDAEYTSLNPALSLLVEALATRWNSPGEGGPWVWNTYQAYLKDTPERLRRDAEAADRAGLAFGVKLVRGAYLDKERALAQLQGAEDPTQPDYEATSQSYSRCLELMLAQVSRRGPLCHLMVASHNEASVHQATKRCALGWDSGASLPLQRYAEGGGPGQGGTARAVGSGGDGGISKIFNPCYTRGSRPAGSRPDEHAAAARAGLAMEPGTGPSGQSAVLATSLLLLCCWFQTTVSRSRVLGSRPETRRQAGYAVYKSIPYGSLEEVIPYLIRRAQENRSVLRGARRERELLSQELRRRLLGELGSVGDPEGQVGRLHRLAVSGGPGWALTRLLQKVAQVDGENSAGQTGLYLSALLGRSSAVRRLLAFGANPNHRCLDGSTPMHAGAFSGHSLVMLHLLQAGGDLRLRDRQGRTPRDWAEQSLAKQSWEVLKLFQLCRTHISALMQGGELAPTATLGQWQGCSGHGPRGSLRALRLARADRALRPEQIRRFPQMATLGIGRLSSLWPLGLVMGIPLADPKELLPAQGEPDRTYESSSHTLMANLLWRGHAVTARQLKAPRTQPDVLLADLQHCSTLQHPNLLLLMALSPSGDLSGLCLLFEPVWLGSLHAVLHSRAPSEGGARPAPGLLPGRLLLQVLEALLFLQARRRAHGGLSSHAVQLVRPGLAKVGNLEHGRPLHQLWLWSRPQQSSIWGTLGPGLPPPPELYPWLPLELICGDMPATTSDLYSFCLLAQEVFTGELPWAGRKGPEVKAKLEAGESPALDPLVPAPYQALVQAGLGLGPADRWGSLQSTRYLLREALAQDLTPEVSSPVDRTSLCSNQGSPPEALSCKVAPKAKTTPEPVPPALPLSPSLPQTLEAVGRSGAWRHAAWDSGSSLTLGSSPGPGPSPEHSPAVGISLHCCLEPSSTAHPELRGPGGSSAFVLQAPSTELTRGSLFSSLQK
ncbi:Hydroxyproline dehydrogenase [Galemys pyrenaicus]|uniref:Hydroxyproline dehydrogenase n=1 Tax=Galemys pyrenaicus TaxID=202257 RepID=A0A8J6B070_GALPY|nr:Hydroxyproline dehydrogenase [Galemys pyrenaicus]